MKATLKIPRSVSLHVFSFKHEFYFDIGWYKGDPFKLLSIELLTIDPTIDYVCFVRFQFLYFAISFGLE